MTIIVWSLPVGEGLIAKSMYSLCFLLRHSRHLGWPGFLFGIVLGLCTVPGLHAAENMLVLSPDQKEYRAGPYLQYLRDSEGEITIEDIVALPDDHFTPSEQSTLSLGYSHDAIWLKLIVDAKQIRTDEADWILDIDYPPLDDVRFYYRDSSGKLVEKATGDQSVFSSREIETNTYAFMLPINRGEHKHFYFRIESQGSLRIPVDIYAYDDFIHHVDLKKTFYGTFIGIMLAMLLYNLFLFLSMREATYLYYVLFIVFYMLFHGNLNGLGLQYIWPESPWWANQTLAMGIAGTSLWGALFTRNFLQTRDYTPLLHQLLNAISVASFCLVVWSLVAGNYSLVIQPAMALTLFTFVAFLVIGVRNLLLGNRSARFFLLAAFTIIVGAVGEVLSAVGLVPSNAFTNSLSILGACLFSIFLSFALADRINLLRQEKNRAQMEAQRSLRLVNEHLEHANKTKDQFLATLSHELRTPMNGIIGSLDLLQQTKDENKKADYVDTATGCAANMVIMIEQLLGYSELQSGTLQLVNQPFNLRNNINTLSLTFERLAEHKGLRYICEVDDSVPTRVVGDQSRLNQILSLMLDNAIKFTEKGEIGIRFSLAECSTDPKKSDFHITIWDTGIGIPEQKQQQIFDYFYQTDASYDRQFGGLGIGLALCKHLAALFNGEIKVSSREGEGTHFDIVIELDIDASQPAEEGKQHRHHNEIDATREILVVEDNVVNQMLLKGILKKLNYTVVTANNGLEAIDVARQHPVAAVLMDLQMPVMDGFDSTRQLRALDTYKNTPILAVTANASAEDRKRCMAVGMNDFIKKPVDIKTIEKHLNHWLS